jgi:hypothetical protein
LEERRVRGEGRVRARKEEGLHCVACCCCCCCCADPAEHAWLRLCSAHLWLHPWLLAAPSFRRLSSRLRSRGRTLSEPRELLLCPVAAAGRELPRRHNSSRWTAWTLIMATPINLQVQLLAVIHTASCTRRNQLPKHRSWQKGRQARAVRYIPGKDGRKL